MYLRSGTYFRSGQRGSATSPSVKSSEESVTNSRPTLEPIEEVDTPTNTSTTMDSETPNDTMPDLSLAFNMRLAFVKRNSHDAQLFRDPMGRWEVKVEDDRHHSK